MTGNLLIDSLVIRFQNEQTSCKTSGNLKTKRHAPWLHISQNVFKYIRQAAAKMNWEALGTIAEIVGATAVVITLIYLSVQTRLTRIAAEETSKHATQQATNAAVEMYSRWRAMTISGADVAETVSKARLDEPLTERENVILEAYYAELFLVSGVAYRSAINAASGHIAPNDVKHLASVLSGNSFAYEYWQIMKEYVGNVCAEFVVEVDKRLAQSQEDFHAQGQRPNKLLDTPSGCLNT